MTDISGILTPGTVSALVGAVIGFFLEPMKSRVFGPRLLVRFDSEDGRHVADSEAIIEREGDPPQTAPSRWVRISVENNGLNHLVGCEAYVVAVEHEQNGQWTPTAFIDPLRLPWSAAPDSETAWRTRDLPRGVQFFVDVCHSTHGVPAWDTVDSFGIAGAPQRPVRLQDLFSEHGRYRITVKVTGNGIRPATQCVIITWTGDWDKLQTANS
jgi:hypothetical protein